MIVEQVAIFILSVFFLAALGVAAILGREVHHLKQEVLILRRGLSQAMRRRKPAEEKGEDFASVLVEAEFKKKLARQTGNRQAPEKYRYVATLAGYGMESVEIAAILNLAPAEAEQLLALSRVAQGPQDNGRDCFPVKMAAQRSQPKDFTPAAET